MGAKNQICITRNAIDRYKYYCSPKQCNMCKAECFNPTTSLNQDINFKILLLDSFNDLKYAKGNCIGIYQAFLLYSVGKEERTVEGAFSVILS